MPSEPTSFKDTHGILMVALAVAVASIVGVPLARWALGFVGIKI